MDKYEEIEKIGKGSFGTVYMCMDNKTGEMVAIKKVIIADEYEGVPSNVLREISLLKEMKHDNIVKLLDVQNKGSTICLVFELLDLDLHTFLTNPEIPKNSHLIKRFMHQILCGVAYCHSHKILHRDLKPQNLLIDLHNKLVKVADFGFGRAFGVPIDSYTRKVVTPWYRAPELLLGLSQYSTPLDIWSVGCIFSEMVIQRRLFNGISEVEILFSIFGILGTPNEETWPGVTSLRPFLSSLPKFEPKDLAKEFSGLEPAGVDLLSKMLQLDPSKRITAPAALDHEYLAGVWSGSS